MSAPMAPAGPDDTMPLNGHLRHWLRHLTPSPRDGIGVRILHTLRSYKVSLLASVLTLLVGVADVAAARSMHEASVPVTLSMGVYSSVFAHVLFVRRLPALRKTVAILVNVTASTEDYADLQSKASMLWTAKRSARLCRQLFVFSVALLLQFPAVYTLTIDPQWSLRWVGRLHDKANRGTDSEEAWVSWLHWGAFTAQVLGLLCSFTAFYTMLAFVILVYSTFADLLSTLAHRLLMERCTPQGVSLLSSTLEACLVADGALSDLMPHLLVVSVVMPLFSTAELLSSGFLLGAYSLGTAAPILIVFVPLCEVGDRLAAARLGVAQAAASGPWLEEPAGQRRLRLGVLQAAGGSGGLLRGSGIGMLNRIACGNALRSWFSFLQVLLNVNKHHV